VLSAENDAQVPESDGDAIFAVSPSKQKRRGIIAAANHVYKKETRKPAEMTPTQIAVPYAEEGRELAPGFAGAVIAFVRTNTKVLGSNG
jgi:hypothetical protein